MGGVDEMERDDCEGGDVEGVVRKQCNISSGEDNFGYRGWTDHKRGMSI